MASASSLAHFGGGAGGGEKGLETIEIDPQYGGSLGLEEGDLVSLYLFILFLEFWLMVVVYRLRLGCCLIWGWRRVLGLSRFLAMIGRLSSVLSFFLSFSFYFLRVLMWRCGW
jgi:hypothetical protein